MGWLVLSDKLFLLLSWRILLARGVSHRRFGYNQEFLEGDMGIGGKRKCSLDDIKFMTFWYFFWFVMLTILICGLWKITELWGVLWKTLS